MSSSVNNISSDLKRTEFLDVALQAYTKRLLPLNAFSTSFSGESIAKEGDEVDVLYVPAAAAGRDFEGTYTVQPTDAQVKKVAINRHKYVSWGLKDIDMFSAAGLTMEAFAIQKGNALADVVIADVLSLVTSANFGNAAFTGAASSFDLDAVADLQQVAEDAHWPDGLRNLVLNSTYYTNVAKDNTFQDAAAAGSTSTRETGKLPPIYGFTPYRAGVLPANGEKLVGFINIPSAIAVAMRYLAPRRPERYIATRSLVDPSGITMGFRHDYDTKTGVETMILEANYGYSVLEAAALKRLRSAA